MQSKFIDTLKQAAEKFKAIDKPFKIVCHFDADGLCSAAILSKLFELNDKVFSLSIVRNLDKKTIEELKNDSFDNFIFADFGSSQISLIEEILVNKTIFILDHHIPTIKSEKTIHINPLVYDINDTQYCGATITYLFCKEINPEIKNLAHIALIGAIGDNHKEFNEIDKKILDDAINSKILKAEENFKFYGFYSKPISKILEQSDLIDIEGITLDRDAANKFLLNLDIEPNTKIYDLDKEKKENLLKALLENIGEENKNKIYGTKYIIQNEKEDSPYRDLREFSTLLNSCGKLDNPQLAIGALLGDENSKILAIHNLTQYKEELNNAIQWFVENKQKVIHTDKFVILNLENKAKSSLIGTISSILSKSRRYKYDFVVAMGRNQDNTTKISMRTNTNFDLKQLAEKILNKIENANFGGHKNCLGANIPTKKEEEFIENIKSGLNQITLEETIA